MSLELGRDAEVRTAGSHRSDGTAPEPKGKCASGVRQRDATASYLLATGLGLALATHAMVL